MTRVLLVAAFTFTCASLVRADEEIPLDKVPPGAVKAVKEKYPKARIVRVEKDDDDGRTVYEFDLKDGDKKVEAGFTADGKFVKAEEEIGEKDVPPAVMAAFKQKHPAAKPSKVEKVTRGDGAQAKVVYEFDIKDGDKDYEVYFSPDGKFVEKKDTKPGKGGGKKPEKK